MWHRLVRGGFADVAFLYSCGRRIVRLRLSVQNSCDSYIVSYSYEDAHVEKRIEGTVNYVMYEYRHRSVPE